MEAAEIHLSLFRVWTAARWAWSLARADLLYWQPGLKLGLVYRKSLKDMSPAESKHWLTERAALAEFYN